MNKQIQTIKATSIDISKRFDIYPKLLFARSMKYGFKTNHFKNIYEEHTFLMNGFREFDNRKKNSKEKFILEFEGIMNAYKVNQVPMEPIRTKDFSLVNGLHRMAGALVYNSDVNINKENNSSHLEGRYLWPYTKNADIHKSDKVGRLKMYDADYLGLMEFVKYVKNARVLVLTPNATNKSNVESFLFAKCLNKIIYKRSIKLTYAGYINLNNQLYGLETWANQTTLEKHTRYCTSKVEPDEKGMYEIDLYVLNIDLAESLELKAEIRNMFSDQTMLDYKTSCHMNDTYAETIDLVRSLFGLNTEWVLNNSHTHQYHDVISRLCSVYKHSADLTNDESDLIAISGSSAIDIFIDAKPKDVDIVTTDGFKWKEFCTNNENTGSCNYYGDKYLKYFDIPNFDQLVLKPENYFWLYGMKFLMPDVLQKCYNNRWVDEKKNKDKKRLASLISFFSTRNFM